MENINNVRSISIYIGNKIKKYYKDKLEKEITNIVLGDINGDGELLTFDIVRINNKIISENSLNQSKVHN